MIVFKSNSTFQFWHYQNSHGVLLLRSPAKKPIKQTVTNWSMS